jgi:hypothetical protein
MMKEYSYIKKKNKVAYPRRRCCWWIKQKI